MRRKLLLPILLLLTLSLSPIHADPLVSVDISYVEQNRYAGAQYAPAIVRYKITVEPYFENVWYCWGWTSDDAPIIERRSCQQLNGQAGPRTSYFEYRNVGEGNYEAFVEVYRAPNRIAAKTTKPFRILPALGS